MVIAARSAALAAILFVSLWQPSCAPVLLSGESVADQPWLVGEKLYYGPQAVSGDRLALFEPIVHEDRSRELYIKIYDLRTRRSERVFTFPEGVWPNIQPAIDGDRVVWSAALHGSTDTVKSNYDIFMLDLKTGEVSQITTEEHVQIEPRISGDTIVWLDTRHMASDEYPPYYDVCAYDLRTGREKRLTTTTSIVDESLSISGNTVVWSDARYAVQRPGKKPGITDQNNEIFLYDLAAGQERRITENPGDDMRPSVDGTRIVWLRQPDALGVHCDVFLHDMQTGEETQISTGGYAVRQVWPSISGNMVVWSDSRLARGNSAGDVGGIAEDGVAYSGASEIYSFDLDTRAESLLVPAAEHRYTGGTGETARVYVDHDIWMRPILSGDYLVFELETGTQPYLYAMNLPARR